MSGVGEFLSEKIGESGNFRGKSGIFKIYYFHLKKRIYIHELKKRFKSSFKEFVAALLVPKDIFLDFSIGLCVAFEIII